MMDKEGTKRDSARDNRVGREGKRGKNGIVEVTVSRYIRFKRKQRHEYTAVHTAVPLLHVEPVEK